MHEHDDDGEAGASDKFTTTSVNTEDPRPCSYHLYHRLITYPLEEIRLLPAQVGGVPDRCVRNVLRCLVQQSTYTETRMQLVVHVQEKQSSATTCSLHIATV